MNIFTDNGLNKHDAVLLGATVIGTIATFAGIIAGYKGNQVRATQLNNQLNAGIKQAPPPHQQQ